MVECKELMLEYGRNSAKCKECGIMFDITLVEDFFTGEMGLMDTICYKCQGWNTFEIIWGEGVNSNE